MCGDRETQQRVPGVARKTLETQPAASLGFCRVARHVDLSAVARVKVRSVKERVDVSTCG